MSSERKFYKTVVTVEVLHENRDDINDNMKLADVAEAIFSGPCSGKVSFSAPIEIGPKTAAKKLMEQGSDPGFFQLDEEGNDSSLENNYIDHKTCVESGKHLSHVDDDGNCFYCGQK